MISERLYTPYNTKKTVAIFHVLSFLFFLSPVIKTEFLQTKQDVRVHEDLKIIMNCALRRLILVQQDQGKSIGRKCNMYGKDEKFILNCSWKL
jgi:hypothetical protein